MEQGRRPGEVIAELAGQFAPLSDAEVLQALAACPPLEDEHHPCWADDEYWTTVAYRYLALADVAAERRLKSAISLLLERACYGDPGEIMRGLRHNLEAIVNPDWSALADICLEAAKSPRPGTRLWAIDELAVLDDPRSKPTLEAALTDSSSDIRTLAQIGLDRLRGARG